MHAAKLGTFHDFSSLIDHNIFIFMVVSVSLLAQETRHNENSINASFMYVWQRIMILWQPKHDETITIWRDPYLSDYWSIYINVLN